MAPFLAGYGRRLVLALLCSLLTLLLPPRLPHPPHPSVRARFVRSPGRQALCYLALPRACALTSAVPFVMLSGGLAMWGLSTRKSLAVMDLKVLTKLVGLLGNIVLVAMSSNSSTTVGTY